MKIIVDAKSDRVIGVHILGHEAGEMAQLLGIAVKMKAINTRRRTARKRLFLERDVP